jgi:hypothetical protein
MTANRETRSEFYLETLDARRVFLGKTVSKRAEFYGLALWIAPATHSFPFIALIEDYRGKAERAEIWSGNSTLGLLLSELKDRRAVDLTHAEKAEPQSQQFNIICEADQVEHHTSLPLLVEALKRLGVSEADKCEISRFSRYEANLRFDLHVDRRRFEAWISRPQDFRSGTIVTVTLVEDRQAETAGRFVSDTFNLVREWGGDVGPERRIDTLFRLRHMLIERDAQGGPGAMIGYPIFVAEHPSGFL